MKTPLLAAALCAAAIAAGADEAKTIDLPVYGKCTVVDVVDCTKTDHRFADWPAGSSRVETILGKPCRVLDVQAEKSSYVDWRLGEGKGLKPDGAYVVVIEYPDDLPRSFFVRNYGNNSRRSFYTGPANGDAYDGPIVGHNPESLKIPQTGKMQLWSSLTILGSKASNRRDLGKDEATKAGEKPLMDIATDGFEVAISQYKRAWNPGSAGIAVSRILLCEIKDEKAAWAKIVYPPDPLPRRRIFWREEMSDGACNDDGICPGGSAGPGTMWWEQKCRAMKILGQNTFCKDMLEFGHNQDWDPNWKHGEPGAKSWRWMWGTNGSLSDMWARLVPLVVDQYGLEILPYYEYSGGIGAVPGSLGPEKRAQTLNGQPNYTHITWSEGKARVDITDPDTLEDLEYVLQGTILRFKPQVEKGGFAGAWFRPRPGQWPVSFADATRARFGQEANGGTTPTRADLQNNRALYDKYIDWFGKKRAEFCDKIRQYLEDNGVKGAIVVLDNDASEPGHGLDGMNGMVTDDPAGWKEKLPHKEFTDIADPRIVGEHRYLKTLKTPSSTWGQFEWQHACPGGDPEHYQGLKNVWIALPFHALFTVIDPGCFSAYRNGNGTETIVRHYDLNEGTFDSEEVLDPSGSPVRNADGKVIHPGITGYAMADWERAGRACMLSEIHAMANGDPVNLGYLMGSQFSRGFPGPVRDFNLNFLALPALPSKRLDGASSDKEVVVRVIDAGKFGKYYALVHTGAKPKKGVKVKLPGATAAQLPVSGKALPLKGGVAVLDFLPWQLVAVRAK